jgi:toxin CptA
VSSQNDCFECRWRPSRRLFALYGLALLLAVCSTFILQLPAWARLALLTGCLAHGAWVLPRHVLLTAASAISGVRRTPQGWAVFSRRKGWQAVQLLPDSMALPQVVILRYRVPGQWWARSACVPADALGADTHRRLRLRLRWSRHRFAPPACAERPAHTQR